MRPTGSGRGAARRTAEARRHEQEVVRQEVERRRLRVLLAAVHLEPPPVVDVDVLLLRRREELLVVQHRDVAHRLAHLHPESAGCLLQGNDAGNAAPVDAGRARLETLHLNLHLLREARAPAPRTQCTCATSP
jgi:hypothetical protein